MDRLFPGRKMEEKDRIHIVRARKIIDQIRCTCGVIGDIQNRGHDYMRVGQWYKSRVDVLSRESRIV